MTLLFQIEHVNVDLRAFYLSLLKHMRALNEGVTHPDTLKKMFIEDCLEKCIESHHSHQLLEKSSASAPFSRPLCDFYEVWCNLEASTAPKFSSPSLRCLCRETQNSGQVRWMLPRLPWYSILVLKRQPVLSFHWGSTIHRSIISSSTVFPLVSTYLSCTPRVESNWKSAPTAADIMACRFLSSRSPKQ